MESFSDWNGPAKGSSSDVSVAVMLSDYVTLARELQACCRHLSVKGAQKLERRIGTEIKFFQSLSSKDEASQAAQLQSSNLGHFAALVHAACHLPGVTRLLRPFPAPDRPRQHSLEVDLVALQGRAWVKVVARKGQALHLVWAGQGQFGERDMVQQLVEYQRVARHHPVQFQCPQVHAAFYNGLTAPMAAALRARGLVVWAQEAPVHPHVSRMLTSLLPDEQPQEEEESGEDPELLEVIEGLKEHVDLENDLVDDDDDDDDDGDHDEGEMGGKANADGHAGGGGGSGDACAGAAADESDAAGETRAADPRPDCGLDDSDLVCDGDCAADVVDCDGGEEETGLEACAGSVERAPHGHRFGSYRPDPPRGDRSSVSTASVMSRTPLAPNTPQNCPPSSSSSSLSSSPSSGRNARSREVSSAWSDLEPDCAPRESAPHRHPQGSEDDALRSEEAGEKARSGSAWRMTSPSRRSLARLLTSCPDLSCLGHGEDGGSGGATDTAPLEGGGGGGRERVNLDITTLITLVSAVCHGGCQFRFRERVLDLQAEDERQRPTLPQLQAFLHDKEWIVCRTAWSDFQSIVGLLGGPEEQKRAEHLLNRVTVVADKPSARAANLRLRGKVKDRSKVVFGTGDEMQAVTVTANSGFIRAAESQNVSFAVHMHPARALTEQKQLTASPL